MQNKLKCHQKPTQLLLWQSSLKNWNFVVLLLNGNYDMVPDDVFWKDMQDHHRCTMVVLLVNMHDGSALSAGLTAQHSCIMQSFFWKGKNIHVRKSVSSGLAYWEVLVTTKHVVQKSISSPNKVIENLRGLGVSKAKILKESVKLNWNFWKGATGENWKNKPINLWWGMDIFWSTSQITII